MATFTLAAFLRLAVSIVSMSLAFIVLNFAGSAPLDTFHSLRRQVRTPRSAATGILRLLIGGCFGFCSLVLTARSAPGMTRNLLSTLAVLVVITALIVEALVGEMVRRRLTVDR